MIYLLDTDALTHLAAAHPRVTRQFDEAAGHDVGTTIITKVEMPRGRYDFVLKAADEGELLRAQDLLLRTEEFLSGLLVVPFDEAAGSHFARLRSMKGLKKVGRTDLLIACIVLAHGATLVSRNLRHFRLVPGLTVINWVD